MRESQGMPSFVSSSYSSNHGDARGHPLRPKVSPSQSGPSLEETDDESASDPSRNSGWPRLQVRVTPATRSSRTSNNAGIGSVAGHIVQRASLNNNGDNSNNNNPDYYEIRIAEEDHDLETDPIVVVTTEFSVFRERLAALEFQGRHQTHGWFFGNETGWLDRLCARAWDTTDEDEWTTDRASQRAHQMEALLENTLNRRGADLAILDSVLLGLHDTNANTTTTTAATTTATNNRLRRILGKRRQIAQAHERQRSSWEQARSLGGMAATTTDLRFETAMQFRLATNGFSLTGNGVVWGPAANDAGEDEEKLWFLLERTDFPLADLMPMPDNTYRLVTAGQHRVPLLELKITYDCQCDIHWLDSSMKKSRTEALGLDLERRYYEGWRFVVTAEGSLSGRGIAVRARRRDDDDETNLATILVDGREAASLEADLSNHYSFATASRLLRVRPHKDCVLVVGLAFAVVLLQQAARRRAAHGIAAG